MSLSAIVLSCLLAPTIGLPAAPALPEGSLLLQRFVRAVGGEGAIRGVRHMTVSGRIHLPGVPEPGQFRWAVADGGRCTFKMSFPDLGQSTFGSNGRIGWEVIELDGQRQYAELDLDVVEARRRRANWFELALNLPGRAQAFTTIGRSSFDGIDAFEVKMLDAADRLHHLFFAADSHLLLGVRLIERGPLGPADVTIRFSEWKPIGSLVLFRKVTINHANIRLELVFDSISLDPTDSSLFEPPKPPDATSND
jgi:hypothetical protein